MVKKILIGALLVLFCTGAGFAVIENSVLNKKGCCSRHGGVCGCKYNKARTAAFFIEHGVFY